MQEFLNSSLKPYNALTREEKHTLLDAMIDGNCERYYEDGWFETKEFDDRTHRVYRTKPKEYKKLDIPWQVIDAMWKWAAMDGDTTVRFYKDFPEYNKELLAYVTPYKSSSLISCLKLDTTGIVAEHSLTTRPEGV